MKEQEHQAPFEGLSEEQIKERLDAYENAKAEARQEEIDAGYRKGVVDNPEKGKIYVRCVFPEGVMSKVFSYGDERGGRTLELKNGVLIELDKGKPVNPILRSFVESGELSLDDFTEELS